MGIASLICCVFSNYFYPFLTNFIILQLKEAIGPGNEKLSRVELWMPEIQSYIHQTIGKLMESAGFKMHKPDFSFKRIRGKYADKFGFLFVNQPVYFRVNFLLETDHPEIRKIKTSFPPFREINHFRFSSLILFMGDLIDHPPAYAASFDYALATYQDLFLAAESMKSIIQEKALPLCDAVCSLDGLDSFFINRPCWSVNSLELSNISTELITAKLNGKRNFPEVFEQIMAQTAQKTETRELHPEIKKIIERLYHHLK